MKKSKYNFFIKYSDDEYIAYNSLTNALAIVTEKEYLSFSNDIESLSENELKNFKYGGFLIDDQVDELELIRFYSSYFKFSRRTLGLTIAPTLECNFRCIYCYEKDQNNNFTMNFTTQENLLDFINNRIKHTDRLDITWYGGEPLLAISIIENLSQKIIEICDKNQVAFSAGIITNGYLLDEKCCETLKRCKITFVQITLDGTKEIHDKRRILKDGSGSFDQIIENLKGMKNFKFDIALRVNVDTNNEKAFSDLIECLEKNNLLKYVDPYMAIVTPTNNRYSKEICFSPEKAAISIENSNKLLESKNKKIAIEYPANRFNFCGADNINSFVIDPWGNVYSCWNEIGIESAVIFNIDKQKNDAIEYDRKNLFNKLKFLMYDPTNNEQCKECKCLPICMGGCPYERLQTMNKCNDFKYNLDNILIRYVKNQSKISSTN